ncbi:MAG TPA: imidazole glycerol phosphate synthase subunit HisH [Candidatus Aphodousia faecigallinarum]|uniref:Imidazole glycerol phosphate synthase subunit HisH n=1 Tax=Candidatus Aphodousia faecigallinarum TaxID=2840677 RepID=A0A9D1IH47_9BURK|nr:imidazole glycerol phosphate synthase subunit HisH [Candidatus Aphodousia faecigallinarum]
MTVKIVVLDTGCCNLTSLCAAIRRLGVEPIVTDEASVARQADRLFLPGVGTAQAAMRELQKRGLTQCIVGSLCPVLGICLGMQLLGAQSEESGGVPMLGVIDQTVSKLQVGELTLPHMGWNRVKLTTNDPLFEGLQNPLGEYFYFVHSYAYSVNPQTIATAEYGVEFSAAIRQGNFYGVQFHPERSGAAGARLLANFIGGVQ